jgi:hypothetical protein
MEFGEAMRRLRTDPGTSPGEIEIMAGNLLDMASGARPKRGPQYMDNPPACGAPADWRWGYLPCGCRNDGYGNHADGR